MPSRAPCSPKSRYVTKALSVQRGLSPNRRHRETLPQRRYTISGRVCAPFEEGDAGRTACYSEHSRRRKNCPLLSSDGTHTDVLTSGMHYEDGNIFLGPYAKGRDTVKMKEFTARSVFEASGDPGSVASRMKRGSDDVVPTLDEMSYFVEKVVSSGESSRVKANVTECYDELTRRVSLLDELKTRCSREVDLQAACRRFLRNAFMCGMYMRKWAGPGTPYPVDSESSSLDVGQEGKRVSGELIDGAIHMTPSGEVKVKDMSEEEVEDFERSDFLRGGRLASMLEAHLRAAFYSIDSIPSSSTRAFVRERMFASLPCRTTENTRWPSGDLFHATLFGFDPASSSSCRETSASVIQSCELLLPIFYKTRPQWSIFEGNIFLNFG